MHWGKLWTSRRSPGVRLYASQLGTHNVDARGLELSDQRTGKGPQRRDTARDQINGVFDLGVFVKYVGISEIEHEILSVGHNAFIASK